MGEKSEAISAPMRKKKSVTDVGVRSTDETGFSNKNGGVWGTRERQEMWDARERQGRKENNNLIFTIYLLHEFFLFLL